MAIIACLIGAPISIFANTVIVNVLSVETSNPLSAVQDGSIPTDRKLSLGVSRRHSSVTEQKQRSSVTGRSLGLTALNPLAFMYANTDQLGTTFNEDLSQFMSKCSDEERI